jgi:hypothetical protein
MSIVFIYKFREQEGRTGPAWWGLRMGEEVRKGHRWVNIVQILCIEVCKWKNETC